MKTTYVQSIETANNNLVITLGRYSEKLKQLTSDITTPTMGVDKEYSFELIRNRIKKITSEISFLLRAHKLFVDNTSSTERKNIHDYLAAINSGLSQLIVNHAVPNNQNVVINNIDALKILLRNLNFRNNKNWIEQFHIEHEKLCLKGEKLSDGISKVNDNILKSDLAHDEIIKKQEEIILVFNSLNEKKEELEGVFENFKKEYDDLKNLATVATENKEKSDSALKAIEINKITFQKFITTIDQREQLFTKQDNKFSDYDDLIKGYEEEQNTLKEEAKKLIDDAKIALGYSTAKGLSDAFSQKYDESKNYHYRIWWLVGAGIFLLATIGLGIWTVSGVEKANALNIILARLSLIPFTILAALFCGNRYLKQKEIIEDYSYKSVLAKSMVGFLEELRDANQEKYAEYISTVLREIHQDPLRKRGQDDKKDEILLDQSLTTFGKMIEMLKPIVRE